MTTRHTYTTVELASITDAAATGDFLATMLAAYTPFGIDLTDNDGPQISPSDYAIPDEQWHTICQALIDATRGELAGANRAMDWVNVGPSGFTPGQPS